MTTKLLCIYLPQFHVIPENNEWWGEGFTEWYNVKRGRSFYPGHYQPREPLDDDYYDLADLKVLERHTRMASKAGISGFCFYHYYFKGKTLLEKPIESYRDNSKEKFPYCLIWANQSWERTWYRSKVGNSMLLKQTYGDEKDWTNHFYYLLDFFKDERYLKINNKPVYIIYIPQDIKCKKRMFAVWKRLAKENGFNGLYLIAMNTSYGMDKNNQLYDAYMDFEPASSFREDMTWRRYITTWQGKNIHRIDRQKCSMLNKIWAKNIYTYSYLSKAIQRKAKKYDAKMLFGVFPGWDNTARKDEAGIIVRGSTPRHFEEFLYYMMKLSEQKSKPFLFLNAWNEWSEGAYIEADKKYGYGYLKAVRNAMHRCMSLK